jgi:hypothetical protein
MFAQLSNMLHRPPDDGQRQKTQSECYTIVRTFWSVTYFPLWWNPKIRYHVRRSLSLDRTVASWIQSILSRLTYIRSILKLCSHQHLRLPSGLLHLCYQKLRIHLLKHGSSFFSKFTLYSYIKFLTCGVLYGGFILRVFGNIARGQNSTIIVPTLSLRVTWTEVNVEKLSFV